MGLKLFIKIVLSLFISINFANFILPINKHAAVVTNELNKKTSEESVNNRSSSVGNDVTSSNDKKQNESGKDIHDALFTTDYGLYKDEKVFYKLDITSDKEKLEESTVDTIWNYLSFGFVDDKTAEVFYSAMFFATETIFRFNVMMTRFMLTVLNFGYDFNIINELVDGLEESVSKITGITSEGRFSSKGLFGGFVGLVTLLAVAYTIYAYLVRKASIESLEGILKTVLALTAALLFFSSYSTILKGMNLLTTEASSLVLSGSTEKILNEDVSNKTLRQEMNDNIWIMFVERPYLYFQYGTDDRSQIGEDRIKTLLMLKPYSKERNDFVEEEVIEKNNEMMTYPNAPDRFTFSWIVMIANGIASIPIFLLGFCLLLFQIWFMALATIAPFAFIFAALPGQFGVLKKYLGELALPLALKVVVSLLALFLFLMSEVVYNINLNDGTGNGYIATLVVQFIIFASLFLLRKRIMGIFSVGSKEIAALRAELGTLKDSMRENGIEKPLKGTTTAAGTAIGSATGGAQGALIGANLGYSLGKNMTGERSLGDTAREVGKNVIYWQLKKDRQDKTAHLSKEQTEATNSNQQDKASATTPFRRDTSDIQNSAAENLKETHISGEDLPVTTDNPPQAAQHEQSFTSAPTPVTNSEYANLTKPNREKSQQTPAAVEESVSGFNEPTGSHYLPPDNNVSKPKQPDLSHSNSPVNPQSPVFDLDDYKQEKKPDIITAEAKIQGEQPNSGQLNSVQDSPPAKNSLGEEKQPENFPDNTENIKNEIPKTNPDYPSLKQLSQEDKRNQPPYAHLVNLEEKDKNSEGNDE